VVVIVDQQHLPVAPAVLGQPLDERKAARPTSDHDGIQHVTRVPGRGARTPDRRVVASPAMSGDRLVAWRGPDPLRVDVAAVRLGSDHLTAHGTSTTPDHATEYRLQTGTGWVTRQLEVRTRGDGWARTLLLERSTDGEWSALRAVEGTARSDEDDDARVPDLAGALDCDLGLCPLTNTMPVLRHDLVRWAHEGAGTTVDLTTAWVSVPDLVVHASPQTYSALHAVDPGGGAVLGFSSEGFSTAIEVDADGLVVAYPGIALRIVG
jgi:hypothetical protein